jgi:hypothetical protein
MFNSKFDSWQLANILQTPWTTPAQQAAVIAYGADFMQQFQPVAAEQKNGAFITSCICHGCPWSSLVLDGMTSLQHYARWHAGACAGENFARNRAAASLTHVLQAASCIRSPSQWMRAAPMETVPSQTSCARRSPSKWRRCSSRWLRLTQ